MSCIERAGWFSGLFSAVKLYQSVSISGPSATSKPIDITHPATSNATIATPANINQRTRSNAKTLVVQASNIALGRSEGDGAAAVTAAISALDKAAEKGIIHPNNAARRKSRLAKKLNQSAG